MDRRGEIASAVEQAAQEYFAVHPSVFDTQPEEFPREPLAALSPFSRTVVEWVVTDWVERVRQLRWPWELIRARLQEGPVDGELAEALAELRQLSPSAIRERAKQTVDMAGDPVFESAASVVWAAVEDEDRQLAETYLRDLLGPGFVERLARRTGSTRGEAGTAAMQAAYEVIIRAVERGDRAENQRAVFRTAVDRLATERIMDAPPRGVGLEDQARDLASPEPLSAPDARLKARAEADDLERQLRARGLTSRECELALALALDGAPSLAEAARDLGMAESTARVHAANIRKKLKIV
jgi:DNA-binding CsgD family transcriptional regulator